MNGKTGTRTVVSVAFLVVAAFGSLSACSGALDDTSAVGLGQAAHPLSLTTADRPAPG